MGSFIRGREQGVLLGLVTVVIGARSGGREATEEGIASGGRSHCCRPRGGLDRPDSLTSDGWPEHGVFVMGRSN